MATVLGKGMDILTSDQLISKQQTWEKNRNYQMLSANTLGYKNKVPSQNYD